MLPRSSACENAFAIYSAIKAHLEENSLDMEKWIVHLDTFLGKATHTHAMCSLEIMCTQIEDKFNN